MKYFHYLYPQKSENIIPHFTIVWNKCCIEMSHVFECISSLSPTALIDRATQRITVKISRVFMVSWRTWREAAVCKCEVFFRYQVGQWCTDDRRLCVLYINPEPPWVSSFMSTIKIVDFAFCVNIFFLWRKKTYFPIICPTRWLNNNINQTYMCQLSGGISQQTFHDTFVLLPKLEQRNLKLEKNIYINSKELFVQ